MPVVFTSKGEKTPGKELDSIVLWHLQWTQRPYGELPGTTFNVEHKVRRARGVKTLEEYRRRDGDAVVDFAAEPLKEFGYNRFHCRYLFLIVVVDSALIFLASKSTNKGTIQPTLPGSSRSFRIWNSRFTNVSRDTAARMQSKSEQGNKQVFFHALLEEVRVRPEK